MRSIIVNLTPHHAHYNDAVHLLPVTLQRSGIPLISRNEILDFTFHD